MRAGPAAAVLTRQPCSEKVETVTHWKPRGGSASGVALATWHGLCGVSRTVLWEGSQRGLCSPAWSSQPGVVQWWRLRNTGKPREVARCRAVAGQDLVGSAAV